jgi:type VI secretion system secreted protein Hcp
MAEIVMMVTGINGECTTVGFPNGITVTSMSFSNEIELEITTTNATRTMHTIKIGDIELNRPFDLASVHLVDAMIAGRSLGTVTISILKPMADETNSQIVFMTYTLFDTLVKSHAFNADDGGQPTETLGLNFTKVLWNYTQQSNVGGKSGNVYTGYNLLAGQKDTTHTEPAMVNKS